METIHAHLNNANECINKINADPKAPFDDAGKENLKKCIEMNNEIIQKFKIPSQEARNELQKMKHFVETSINKSPEIAAYPEYDALYKKVTESLVHIMSINLDPVIPAQPPKRNCNCGRR